MSEHEYTGTTLTAAGDLIYGETPEDGIVARVYGAPKLARQFAASDEMLRALRKAELVLAEVVMTGKFPRDDTSDRIALDTVREAITEAVEDCGNE